MLVNQILVAASQSRAKKSKVAEEIKKKTGEAPRAPNAPKREARLATLLAESSNPVVARTQLERLIGGNDLVGVSYLERGVLTARSVCRVRLRDAAGQTIG